jgi:transcriptional regulator with XRE-family HTH domain
MSADNALAFGHRLRELRERAGLTQGQLAERAGMHRQGVAKLELGEREPSWSTLLALARALAVDLNTFARGPETKASPRGPGRPPKQAEPVPAPPAPPAAEDLEGQAEAGPAATRGPKPKRPRARRPKRR